MTSVSSALATLIEWLLVGFADIMKLARDGKRTSEQLQPLKDAMQAVIDGKSFEVLLADETIRGLCLLLDPSKIQQGWQQLYAKWLLTLDVPAVPYDQKRIAAEKKRGRILVYVPPELAGKEGLLTLGKLFPKMNSWTTKADRGVAVEPVMSGWLFVEDCLGSPNRNTDEPKLREAFTKQSAQGYGLPVYIIFGQFCREVFGQYPDINTWSRLLGSSDEGDVLSADFGSGGCLYVYRDLNPESAYGSIGGRSAAV